MDIHLEERIASGPRFVVPILLQHLDGYRDDQDGDPPVLDAAGMQVPIALRVGERIGDPPAGARIRIEAKHNTAFFPVFEGSLSITPTDQLNCSLVLDGSYVAPMGFLGLLADRTVLATTAERSLQRLLARMKSILSTVVLQSIMGK